MIRFADVLLMGAELGSIHAQSYLDQVRERVGLSPVPVMTLTSSRNPYFLLHSSRTVPAVTAAPLISG